MYEARQWWRCPWTASPRSHPIFHCKKWLSGVFGAYSPWKVKIINDLQKKNVKNIQSTLHLIKDKNSFVSYSIQSIFSSPF